MIVPRLCLLGWVLSSAPLILHPPFFPHLSELSGSLENRGPRVVIPVIRVLGEAPRALGKGDCPWEVKGHLGS